MKVSSSKRLFFIDAMRAWAIIMMLQGHFIDGLLDPAFRDKSSIWFTIWLYFRGITAPVFFTVSGFIFTYLLLGVQGIGFQNPRVKKGIRRGIELLLIGYALRFYYGGLLEGKIYPGFLMIDVLHCIGISILIIIVFYLLVGRFSNLLIPIFLIGFILIFLFEPVYKNISYEGLPTFIANYLTKKNGSIFTIIPWVGYPMAGACLTFLYSAYSHHKRFYLMAILGFIFMGLLLIFGSSPLFSWINRTYGIELFGLVFQNNYLFIRLGDVFIVFAIFMLLRSLMTHPKVIKIGANTLSIYVIHHIILYGSFTGLGLYRFFHFKLNPVQAISGALVFIVVCVWLALVYNKHEVAIKRYLPWHRIRK